MESSIEISKDGSVFCDYLCDFDVNNFLKIFALTAEEMDYRYFKMREGMVNFNKKDIANILDHCEIRPMVNQIEVHIYNTPLDLINYCKDNDIIDVKIFNRNDIIEIDNQAHLPYNSITSYCIKMM